MIYIVNQSSVVSEADLAKWIAAINRQLQEHFAPQWSIIPPIVLAMVDYSSLIGRPLIKLVDEVDVSGALGYHTESGGTVVGQVGAKTCLDNGASISQCLSHEVLEATKDPFVGGWEDNAADGTSHAREMCDAVQDGTYQIDGVDVSNFLYPAYFDSQDTTGPFDYLGALKAPFTRTPGGYQMVRLTQPDATQLGERPPWKANAYRVSRRKDAHHTTPRASER